MSYFNKILDSYGCIKSVKEVFRETGFRCFLFKEKAILDFSNCVKIYSRFQILNAIQYIENKYGVNSYAISSNKKNQDLMKIWHYNLSWSLLKDYKKNQINSFDFEDIILYKSNLYFKDVKYFDLIQKLLIEFNNIKPEFFGDYELYKDIIHENNFLLKEKQFSKKKNWEFSSIPDNNYKLIINQSDILEEESIYFHSELDVILSGQPYLFFSSTNFYEQLNSDGFSVMNPFLEKDFFSLNEPQKKEYIVYKIKEFNTLNKSSLVQLMEDFYNLKRKNLNNINKKAREIDYIMKQIFKK